jgi:long-chain acyl-CoA synthetase
VEVKHTNNLPVVDRVPPATEGGPGGGSAIDTFPHLLESRVRAHGERVFLPRRRARVVEPVTFRRLAADVELVAAGLVSLGIQHGDRIGLLAENRYEWLLADLGTVSLGAVDVPRGSDTSPAEMVFILRHSGARATFVEDDKTAQAVYAKAAELPDLRFVITLGATTSVQGVLTMPELMERGRNLLATDRERVRALGAAVRPDDLMTIVYTSGTTADPKGVMLTHRNVLSNMRNTNAVLKIGSTDSCLSVLPAWHMYERMLDYVVLAAGGQLVYTDRRHIKDDLMQVAPTMFAAVPRIWETIHDGIESHAHKLQGLQGKILRTALRVARAQGSGKATLGQRVLHRLLRNNVLRKLQAITGGRLRLAVSGGGALPLHVDETLLGIGIPLLNGYGLTETSPVASVRRPEANAPGMIGPPIPETEIEARDGEGRRLDQGKTGILWIRGPQVMRGYYDNPTKTAEVLDAAGWFNSGDLGHIDARGNVWITGRAKDTIVLAGGENVEPGPVEAAIKQSPFVQQIVCLGQDQKSIGALIVPSLDVLEQSVPKNLWDVRDGVICGRAVQDLFRKELDRLVRRDTGFRPCDNVAAFRVITEPLSIENGLLTQTLKVRRHIVQERYQRLIDSMFR